MSSRMCRTIEGCREGVQRSSASLVQRHLLQGRRLRTSLLDLITLAINFNFYPLSNSSNTLNCFARYSGSIYKLEMKIAFILTRP